MEARRVEEVVSIDKYGHSSPMPKLPGNIISGIEVIHSREHSKKGLLYPI
jgi:hypothetical protein